MFKNLQFFQQYANMHPMYSVLSTANLGLCDYVLFLQIWSQMVVISNLRNIKYIEEKSQNARSN